MRWYVEFMRYGLNICTLAGTFALILLTQNLFHWISFVPSTIPYHYLIYTSAIALLVGITLSFILKNKFKGDASLKFNIKSLATRWFKYNLLAVLFTISWSIYISLALNLNFIHILTGYYVVIFSTVNALMLLWSCFVANNINEIEIISIAVVSALSLCLCNTYFSNYFLGISAAQTPYIVFGTIVLTIICLLSSKLGKFTEGSKWKKNINLVSNQNFLFMIASAVFFSITGIGIFQSIGLISILDVVIPTSIIAGTVTMNMITSNSFVSTSEKVISEGDFPDNSHKPGSHSPST